jgi:hypothetical protein
MGRGFRGFDGVMRSAEIGSVRIEKVEVEEEAYEPERGGEAREEFRLAWMWVEGWRRRLTAAGDIVEKQRHEFSDGETKRFYITL